MIIDVIREDGKERLGVRKKMRKGKDEKKEKGREEKGRMGKERGRRARATQAVDDANV